jgi:Protein of unknown function (DUF1838)
MMNRNTFPLAPLAPLACLLLIAIGAPATAQQLDPNKPEDAIRIDRKINCSTEDGRTAVYWWHGKVFSRVPGERDRHIFNVQGFNLRTCKAYSDPQRGPGYRSVSREMLIYFDPQTNQVLRTWKNPWTGEQVEVLHVANDPVSMREPAFARDREGKPARSGPLGVEKDGLLLQGGGAARLFYKNPLGGEYQENIGGWYHAMEALTAASPLGDVLDAGKSEVQDRVISWVRISKWLPWMKMGDRSGAVVFHTAGMRLNSFDEMPDEVKTEVKTNWPAFMQAPPPDDSRPSMTSWDQFKRWVETKKATRSQE